jgi:ribonucleotide monophosphatase NagD (HAD superfamily)
MSTLESKAKSYREIKSIIEQKEQNLIDVAQQIGDEADRKVACQKAWDDGCALEDVKDYVTLKEAQKLQQALVYQHKEVGKLALQIAEANKIVAKIITNPEFQCFNNNGLIPCKASCARYYEVLCKSIQDLCVVLAEEKGRR